jgi:hypothetical protein
VRSRPILIQKWWAWHQVEVCLKNARFQLPSLVEALRRLQDNLSSDGTFSLPTANGGEISEAGFWMTRLGKSQAADL